MVRKTIFGVSAMAALAATAAWAQPLGDYERPTYEADGTVGVPAFDLPPSQFMSEEAKQFLRLRASMADMMPREQNPDIAESRKRVDAMMAMPLGMMRQMYAVDVAEEEIAGVPVRVVTPSDGDYDAERVLINLHGGAFTMCWDSCSLLESIPIAATGDYRVVSVNYRMAPEAAHPAGVEDAAAVYRELLKSHKPEKIGVYGCSAGGALTAQLASWLPAHDMPQPGAVGIFGAGAVRLDQGDSAYVAAYIDGAFPPPAAEGEERPDFTRGYFDGADMEGPLVSPALHSDTIAKFPPALLITGTRAMDMSSAVYTNSQLLKAGVDSTLIVGEGMGHCYIYMAGLPEARDAYAATVAFFREHLE